MNIDDVTRILGYIGEKGGYYDGDHNYVSTTELKTIGELEREYGMSFPNRLTPENDTKLEDYYVDYYPIHKTNDLKKMNYSEFAYLVYPKYSEYSAAYWLSSTFVLADFSLIGHRHL